MKKTKKQIIEFDFPYMLPDPELQALNFSLALHANSRCGKVRFRGDLTHDNLRGLGIILEDMVFKLAAMESIP